MLSLRGAAYVEHGVYRRGDTATWALLTGFAAEVSATLDAPAGP